MMFTDAYGEQSCTAGRAAFITGQSVFRTGLSKVGVPAAKLGRRREDPTIAELLKPLGYATGQFGKSHLGDRNAAVVEKFLATFKDFPPRQKAASFTIDQAIEKMHDAMNSAHQ